MYSARSWDDVIYRAELEAFGDSVVYALTRSQPPGWTGYARRVDAEMLASVAWPSGGSSGLAYVCGPTSFVETVAGSLVRLGYPAERVRTERFGASGQ
jgi:ferredoxin-NADP reductase